MSQYYARANRVLAQDMRVRDMQTLPAAARAMLKTDLCEKYMPGESVTTSGAATATRTACYTVGACVTYDSRKQPDAVPDASNTVSLSALHYSVMTNTAFRGVYWAFLMSHNLKGKKKDTNIGVSKNPIFSVMAPTNQALIGRGDNAKLPRAVFPGSYDKDTASAAPHWKLDTAVGTFYTRKEAIGCCHRWVRKTRGTVSKRERAPELAEDYDNSLYSSQIPINTPLESRLFQLNAPFEYIAESHAIKQQCTHVVQPRLEERRESNEQSARPQKQRSHHYHHHQRKKSQGRAEKHSR